MPYPKILIFLFSIAIMERTFFLEKFASNYDELFKLIWMLLYYFQVIVGRFTDYFFVLPLLQYRLCYLIQYTPCYLIQYTLKIHQIGLYNSSMSGPTPTENSSSHKVNQPMTSTIADLLY